MRALLLLLLFDCYYVKSGFAQHLTGLTHAWALGAYSAEQADIFSFTANQAALAASNRAGIAVGGERKFLIKELALYRFAAVITSRLGNFGLQGITRGFGDFRESRFGLAHARQLGESAAIGLQFNYSSQTIAGYGSASAISAELGVLLHLSGKLHTGFHISNPGGGRSGSEFLEIPSVYTGGLGYDLSPALLFTIEVTKEKTQPVDVMAGIQYMVIPTVLLRFAIQTALPSVLLGAGFCRNRWRLDLYTGYHPQLGSSAGILLMSYFNRKTE